MLVEHSQNVLKFSYLVVSKFKPKQKLAKILAKKGLILTEFISSKSARLDQELALYLKISRNQVLSLIKGGNVSVNDKVVTKAGFNIKQVRAGRLHRRITLENVKNMYNALAGIKDSKKIIKGYIDKNLPVWKIRMEF